MAKNQLPPDVPASEVWQGPLVWVGSPTRPAAEFEIEYPAHAVFVRGAACFTLSQSTGPGMTRQTFRKIPALIRLDRGTAVEFHVAGLDHRCWTYRLEKASRKKRWTLYAGPSFPGTELVESLKIDDSIIEYVSVQSLLTQAGSRKGISFMIREDGAMEDHASTTDPDPDD